MTATVGTVDLIAQFADRHNARDDKFRITRPAAAELAAALAELKTDTFRCGRCSWVCQNPNLDMPQFQMVTHALRHREIEAQDTDALRGTYQMTRVIWDEWAHLIAYAELQRRDVDPAAIPGLVWRTYA
ncbi:hypothetical protein ACFFMN_23920 [Planobispora siamensis]|nr:hypothetical protein [Planobispora siamensis]